MTTEEGGEVFLDGGDGCDDGGKSCGDSENFIKDSLGGTSCFAWP